MKRFVQYYCFSEPELRNAAKMSSSLRLGFLPPVSKRNFLLYLVLILRIVENPIGFLKNARSFRLFGIWIDSDLVGDLMFFPPSRLRDNILNNSVEMSFCLLEKYRGQGLSAPALSLGNHEALQVGTNPIALVRLENVFSNHVCQKLYKKRSLCVRKKFWIFSYYRLVVDKQI